MHGSEIYGDVGCIANSGEKISSFTLELHDLDKISVALPHDRGKTKCHHSFDLSKENPVEFMSHNLSRVSHDDG